jgi:hypothetical protein
MSDSEFNKRRNAVIQRELDEVNEPRNRAQKQLDAWWQAQRDLAWEEQDVYFVGGFMERFSQTPSYTKSKRDRDWRVR